MPLRSKSSGFVRKSVTFGVVGDYGSIRRLVNFLELSDQFLLLEEVRLRETEGSKLGIDLIVSTLFAAPGELGLASVGGDRP